MNRKAAREQLREEFRANNGLTIYDTFYPDLETFRRKDPIAYTDVLDGMIWEPMHATHAIHPERLKSI